MLTALRTRVSAVREAELTGGHHPPRPLDPRGALGLGRRCVTPSQTCPRPSGFGRNLRSKTRWFTGFCNSHQVSHFATFFIDARAEISVAESRYGYMSGVAPCTCTVSGTAGGRSWIVFLGAFGAGGCCFAGRARGAPHGCPTRLSAWDGGGRGHTQAPLAPAVRDINRFTGRASL